MERLSQKEGQMEKRLHMVLVGVSLQCHSFSECFYSADYDPSMNNLKPVLSIRLLYQQGINYRNNPHTQQHFYCVKAAI